MFVRDQLDRRCVNLKYIKEIRVESSHPSQGFIVVEDPNSKVIPLGRYSSLERAQEELNRVILLLSKGEDFTYGLAMDRYVSREEVEFYLGYDS